MRPIYPRIKSRFQRLMQKRQPPGVTAPPEAYASHIPVLIGLGKILKVRRALELGCGAFSTLTLLNQRAFPDLVHLRSLENHRAWSKKARGMVKGDVRCKVEFVSGEICDVLDDVQWDQYDLVFVDDSHTYEQRSLTIRTIAEQQPLAGVILIHDFESPLYQQASKPFSHRFNFDSLLPNTGAHWNHNKIDVSSLEALNEMIRDYAKIVKPMDVDGWTRVFDTGKW